MKLFLLLIPILTTIFGLLIYKYQSSNGIEIFRIDLVQFVYLFLVTPTLYVWLKSFLFYILRNELDVTLSVTEIFVIDTIFSVFAIIVMAALAIHSLTKVFWLKRHNNPEFDLYSLSEYFHLWWSHIVIWGGAMILGTFISIANVFVPLEVVADAKFQLFGVMAVGSIFGAIFFFAIWSSDPKQGNFMKLMKLLLALFLIIHFFIYFILEPEFTIALASYWFNFAFYVVAVISAATFERYERTNKIRSWLLHLGWGENKGVNIFNKK